MHRKDTLSARFDYILRETGLKQTEFADEMGVTVNYVSMILNGVRKNISRGLANLIEAKYGFRAEWLLTGDGEPKKLHSDELRRLAEREIEEDMGKMDDVELGDLAFLAEKIMRERGK
jgi:transcriptional regulator with XRE-family HTH domain